MNTEISDIIGFFRRFWYFRFVEYRRRCRFVQISDIGSVFRYTDSWLLLTLKSRKRWIYRYSIMIGQNGCGDLWLVGSALGRSCRNLLSLNIGCWTATEQRSARADFLKPGSARQHLGPARFTGTNKKARPGPARPVKNSVRPGQRPVTSLHGL